MQRHGHVVVGRGEDGIGERLVSSNNSMEMQAYLGLQVVGGQSVFKSR